MCPTLSKLCDDTKLLIRLKGVKHLDDILMPEASQNLNLLSQADYVLLALAMLEDEFHGHCLACSLPPAFIDLICHVISHNTIAYHCQVSDSQRIHNVM